MHQKYGKPSHFYILWVLVNISRSMGLEVEVGMGVHEEISTVSIIALLKTLSRGSWRRFYANFITILRAAKVMQRIPTILLCVYGRVVVVVCCIIYVAFYRILGNSNALGILLET